jgi:hypothetical protein
MTKPPSRRSIIAVFSATAVAVVVIVTLFVWPGFWPTNCASSSGPTQPLNGRDYCYLTVPIPRPVANYTEWNYRFHLHSFSYPGGPVLNVTVTEPNGTTVSGVLGWVGPTHQNSTSTWISPDASCGAIALWYTHNVSLLVER